MVRFFSLLLAALLIATSAPANAGDKKVIVGFRNVSELTSHEKQDKIHRAGGRIKRSHRLFNVIAAQMPEEEIERLKNDPSVAYVEEDFVISIAEPVQASGTPSQEYADSWGVARIDADAVVQTGIKGTGIKVAILDSGIDYNHPELVDNYKGGYNFAYDNNDPFDDTMSGYTKSGHGTHVAGIIGARENGTGVVGVAPDVSLYAVKVLNGGLSGDVSDIIAGIEWAIENKMQIISMSIGSALFSQALKDACDKAAQAGIVLVAAAGNFNEAYIDYPAAFDSVIAVTATRPDDTRPMYNYGPEMELAAPGVNIKSTIPGGGYGYLTGTSQAAPHVAGVVALLLSAGIQDTNGNGSIVDEVRQRLTSTAMDLGDPGRDFQFGYGLVDAARAVGVSVPSDPQPPVFTSNPKTEAKEGTAYSYTAVATDANGDSITYSLVAAPTGMTIDADKGIANWTPTYKQAGSYAITIRAADAGGLSVDQTFTLTVADAMKNYKLVRTTGKIKRDALVVPLEKGSYTITMTNSGLRNIIIEAPFKPRNLKESSKVYHFNHRAPQSAEFEYSIDTPTSLILIPNGEPGTSADIVITRNS